MGKCNEDVRDATRSPDSRVNAVISSSARPSLNKLSSGSALMFVNGSTVTDLWSS